MFTRDQAAQLVSDNHLDRSADVPEDRLPCVLEDRTVETSFGWVFYTNTRKFSRTGNPDDALTGAPFFIFNKETGEVRRCYTSSVSELIKDYAKELEAKNGSWVIGISDESEKKVAAAAAKQIFSISSTEALKLFNSKYLGRGDWTSLSRLASAFTKYGVKMKITVVKSGFEDLPEYRRYNISAVQNMKTMQIIQP